MEGRLGRLGQKGRLNHAWNVRFVYRDIYQCDIKFFNCRNVRFYFGSIYFLSEIAYAVCLGVFRMSYHCDDGVCS